MTAIPPDARKVVLAAVVPCDKCKGTGCDELTVADYEAAGIDIDLDDDDLGTPDHADDCFDCLLGLGRRGSRLPGHDQPDDLCRIVLGVRRRGQWRTDNQAADRREEDNSIHPSRLRVGRTTGLSMSRARTQRPRSTAVRVSDIR